MTNSLQYQPGPQEEDVSLISADGSPDSGIHNLHSTGDFDEEPISEIRLYDEDYYVSELKAPPAPEKAVPQSWIEGLLTKLKAGISSAPPKAEVQEYIPQDEKELMERIEMEGSSIEMFRNIIASRKRIYEDALTLGMTPEEILESGDYCLDPVMTEAWKTRFRERARLVSDLRITLDTKRTERLARNSVSPSAVRKS